jgi:ABC-2 type transport system ATP-binding protein
VIRRRQQQGRTAILVSHNLADVEQLCDRVAVLREGELAFTGTLNELAGDESTGHLEEALELLYAGAAP